MLRARWAWLAGVGIVVGAGAFIASCSDAREAIGISSAALTAGSVINIPAGGSEISGAWTPSIGGSPDILAMGFNTNQWAFSTNNGGTWSTCASTSPGGCNGAFGAWAAPDSGPLSSFIGLFGDPTFVADKLGHVVQVLLTSNGPGCANSAQGVFAVVSSDGGKTFDWTTQTLVNDTACNDGCQDQPDATFDYSTSPPTLLVSFRHRPSPGHYGACVRRYFIDSTNNHLVAMDDAHDVNNIADGVTGYGVGGVRIRAGGGVMTAVYSTTDSVPRCPSTSPSTEGVGAVSSYDWGVTWSYSEVFWSNSNYTPCVLSGQVDIGANPRNFDYVRAVDGTNYVIYQDTKSTLRLFMDRTYGVNPDPLNPLMDTWREWCPGTATADGGPTTNWLTVTSSSGCPTPFYSQGQASADAGSGNSLAMPNIAADDQGRVAVYFYEADSTDTMFHVHFRGNISPRSPTSTWVDADLTPNFTPGIGGGNRALGDYEAMAVRNALGQPTCGNTGTFFPMWSFANTGGPIDASVGSNPQTIDGGVLIP